MSADRAFFSSGYLTLVSVIQATAFGVFLFTLQPLLSAGTISTKMAFLICEFSALIVVTYAYVAGARDLRWHMDGFDILFPFSLGVSQAVVFLILGIGTAPSSSWFLCYAGFLATGSCAVANALVKVQSHRSAYPPHEVKIRVRSFRRSLTRGILCAAACAAVGVWAKVSHVRHLYQQMAAILLALDQAAIFMMLCRRDWNRNA